MVAVTLVHFGAKTTTKTVPSINDRWACGFDNNKNVMTLRCVVVMATGILNVMEFEQDNEWMGFDSWWWS